MSLVQKFRITLFPSPKQSVVYVGKHQQTSPPPSWKGINSILSCLLTVWLWVEHRNRRRVRYSIQVEQVLYQGDVFWRYGVPFASLATAVMGISQKDLLNVLTSLLPCLYNLMLGSLVFMVVGQSLKTDFPEGSVFAMILSKALVSTAFFITSLSLLPDDSPWRWAVYLMIALLSFTILSIVGYSIWKNDVRLPEEM